MEFYLVFSTPYNTKVAACCCCIGISYSRGRGTTLVPRCLYEFAYRAVVTVLCFIVPFADLKTHTLSSSWRLGRNRTIESFRPPALYSYVIPCPKNSWIKACVTSFSAHDCHWDLPSCCIFSFFLNSSSHLVSTAARLPRSPRRRLTSLDLILKYGMFTVSLMYFIHW